MLLQNGSLSLSSCYICHETLKKNQHEAQIWDTKHASFILIVLLDSGGMGNEASIFYKHPVSCLASKWDQSYWCLHY